MYEIKLEQLDFMSLKGKDLNLIVSILRKEVALEHGIDFKSLICSDDNVKPVRVRKRELVTSRQQIMVFLKKYNCCESLASIGAAVCPERPFDHATVLHALKTVSNLFETDKEYRKKFNNIKSSLDTIFVMNDMSPIEINTVRTPVGHKLIDRKEEVFNDEIRVTFVYKRNIPELEVSQQSPESNIEIQTVTEIKEIRA